MEAVLDGGFAIGYQETTQNLYDELKSRVDTVILNSMKERLRDKGISFDGSSIDLATFKKNVIGNLDNETQVELANLERELNKQLTNVVDELKEGSQTAFGKFAQGFASIGKTSVEMVARATAIKAAAVLNPTLGTAVLGGTIAIPAIVRATKDIKNKSREDLKTALDVMLLKLATVSDGKKAKIDLAPNIMEQVSETMKTEGLSINAEDPVMFVRDVSRLDNDQKERVVNLVNTLKGNQFDVQSELKSVKINLKTIRKSIEKNIVAPISTAAMLGLATAGTLNDIAPDAVPSVITGLGVGAVTGNVPAAVAAASAQYGSSKFATLIPVVGDLIDDGIEQVNKIETTAATTGAAVAATIALKIVPGLVYKGAKGIYSKIKRLKESKSGKDLLDKNIADRITSSQKDVQEEIDSREDKDVMVDIVKDVLRQRGIALPEGVKSPEELRAFIKQLDNDDKKQVYKVASTLEDVKESSDKSLKKTLGKVAKTAYWGGVIALAGLGAYDMFINPGFLEGLRIKSDLEKTLDDIKNSSDATKIKYTEDGRIVSIDSDEEGTVVDLIDENGAPINLTTENIADKVIEAIERETKEDYAEAIETFRQNLPKDEIQIDNFVEGEGNIFTNASTLPSRRNALEALDLTNEEGLTQFFKSLDPNDENLKIIMEKVGVSSPEELATNKNFISSLMDLTKEQNYNDFPSCLENTPNPFEAIQYSFTKSGDVKDAFIDLVNSSAKEALGEIPTQAASDEEIIEFIKELSNNPDQMEMLSKYMYVADVKDTNFIWQNIQDAIGDVKGVFTGQDATTADIYESLKKIGEDTAQADEKAKAVEEMIRSKNGLQAGANSAFETDPYKIAGEGVAIGATTGAIGTVADKKGIFARAKSFILDKIFPARKKKALPMPTIDSSKKAPDGIEQTSKNELEGIKVNSSDLKPVDKTTEVSKNEVSKENDVEER